jgi:hypothetical protein
VKQLLLLLPTERNGLHVYARAWSDRVDVVAELSPALAARATRGGELEAIVSGIDGATIGHARGTFTSTGAALLLRIDVDAASEPVEALVRLNGAGIESLVASTRIYSTRDESIGQPLVYRGTLNLEAMWSPTASLHVSRTQRLRMA